MEHPAPFLMALKVWWEILPDKWATAITHRDKGWANDRMLRSTPENLYHSLKASKEDS